MEIIDKLKNELLFLMSEIDIVLFCTRAENKGNFSYDHNCHKNWDNLAPAMEADIPVVYQKKSHCFFTINSLTM